MKKKLNNKGYLIVEIIVSMTLAMTVAYFLIDLTIKLKDKYEDTYIDTILMTDKAIITNEILGDLYTRNITSVYVKIKGGLTSGEASGIVFKVDDDKYLGLFFDEATSTIKYGEVENDYATTINDGDIIFSQKFDSKLIATETPVAAGKPDGETLVDGSNYIAQFSIPMETLYSNKDYGINIIIPYIYKS